MKEQLITLSNQIHRALGKEFNPFYVITDDDFKVVGDSGNGDFYGYPELKPGNDIYDYFPFLYGLDNIEESYFKLHLVETPSKKPAQIYIVRLDDGWGIGLLDGSELKNNQYRYQQVANELGLVNAERDRLIKRLEKYKDILQEVNRELHQTNKLKSQFIGKMSHEFRTPISSILGYLDLAREDLGSPDLVTSHLSAIDRSANYLLNLIENLIDQSILENGQLVINPTSTNIINIANDLEELFRVTAEKKGLSFVWWIAPEIPERIWIDDIKLRQVLVNLIGNAVKFTKEGSISVSLEWANNILNITVDDTGQGIKPEDLKSIFEHFHKSAADGQSSRGAGLGLSISNEIVKRMGGDLSIKSSLGQGTNIVINLEAPSRTTGIGGEDHLRNSDIVVIDSNSDSRQLLGVFLNGVGAKPYLTASGDEACNYLKMHNPDALIIDMNIEGEDSINTIQKIKKTGYKGPIVALSAVDDEHMRKKIDYAKCDESFIKPLRRTDFIHKMGALLSI